jgi:classical protein kinase C alpha type
LNIFGFGIIFADPPPAEGDRKENLRKPLSGKLYITVKEARELDHAPILKRSSKVFNETTVVVKVEGTARATSHPSRTDRWNEDFEIPVDKANEVEVAVYDKQAGEHSTPIGMFWLRLSDIVEALRRQRVGQDNAQGAWVTAAGAMRESMGGAPEGIIGPGGDVNSPLNFTPTGSVENGLQPEGISAWFGVEPAGALAINVNFGAAFLFSWRAARHFIWNLTHNLSMLSVSVVFSQGKCPKETVGRRRPRTSGCRSNAQG